MFYDVGDGLHTLVLCAVHVHCDYARYPGIQDKLL